MVDGGRGDPWEHDPGPTNTSGWAALFADTPNYRGLGRAVLGREVFRWQHARCSSAAAWMARTPAEQAAAEQL